MIVHPRFRRLVRFKDRDLRGRTRSRVADHVAGCPRCQERLRSIGRTRHRVREATRIEPSPALWERIEESRSRGREVILPGPGGPAVPRRAPRRLSWAAALVLALLGAGTAAVVAAPPGSWLRPLRDLFVPAAEEAPEPTGVQVPISGGSVTVALESPADGLQVWIRLRRGSELGVRATGGAARAVFRPTARGVRIIGAGAGRLEVALPAPIDRALVTVEGVPRWILEDGRVRSLAAPGDGPEVRITTEGGGG